jgi:hypothetical protein
MRSDGDKYCLELAALPPGICSKKCFNHATILAEPQLLATVGGEQLMALSDFGWMPHEGGLISATAEAEFRSADFDNWTGVATAPDHPALRALVGALMGAGPGASETGWRQGDGCAQVIQRVGLEPVRVSLRAGSGEAAWREVCAITPLALDVLTVLIDRFEVDGGGVRLVRCADILAAKGCRRRGEERHALEEQIGRELTRLGQISVGPAEQPIFSVTPVGDQPTSFVVSLDPLVRELWAAAPVRRLSRRLLAFDHRSNRGADVLAKKLGIYLSLAIANGRPVVRSVRALLKAVGALHEVSGGARGGRIADRFEEALLRLEENGLFAAAYRGGSEPDPSRIKGWVKRWLDAELVIEPRA